MVLILKKTLPLQTRVSARLKYTRNIFPRKEIRRIEKVNRAFIE